MSDHAWFTAEDYLKNKLSKWFLSGKNVVLNKQEI